MGPFRSIGAIYVKATCITGKLCCCAAVHVSGVLARSLARAGCTPAVGPCQRFLIVARSFRVDGAASRRGPVTTAGRRGAGKGGAAAVGAAQPSPSLWADLAERAYERRVRGVGG